MNLAAFHAPAERLVYRLLALDAREALEGAADDERLEMRAVAVDSEMRAGQPLRDVVLDVSG